MKMMYYLEFYVIGDKHSIEIYFNMNEQNLRPCTPENARESQ